MNPPSTNHHFIIFANQHLWAFFSTIYDDGNQPPIYMGWYMIKWWLVDDFMGLLGEPTGWYWMGSFIRKSLAVSCDDIGMSSNKLTTLLHCSVSKISHAYRIYHLICINIDIPIRIHIREYYNPFRGIPINQPVKRDDAQFLKHCSLFVQQWWYSYGR